MKYFSRLSAFIAAVFAMVACTGTVSAAEASEEGPTVAKGFVVVSAYTVNSYQGNYDVWSWLPKVTNGWFFRAESFFSVARYLDEVGSPSADFLSYSHGEGFLRFFEERCQRQGIFIFDEPESALSPARQMEFLKLMRRMEESTICQVIMATHSPMLLAFPEATICVFADGAVTRTPYTEVEHVQLMKSFLDNPQRFLRHF